MTIRYRRSRNHRQCRLEIEHCLLYDSFSTLSEKSMFVGSEERMVARGQFQEWSLRLNVSQHVKHPPGPDAARIDRQVFLDSLVLHGRFLSSDKYDSSLITSQRDRSRTHP